MHPWPTPNLGKVISRRRVGFFNATPQITILIRFGTTSADAQRAETISAQTLASH
jgi:hypothetical protein